MIYLGADHGGFELKEKLKGWLKGWGVEFEDMGNFSLTPNDDYPDFAAKVAGSIKGEDRGILICRTGQGMAMAANRFSHVRALLANSVEGIKRGRGDEDANLLSVAADLTTEEDVKNMVQVFLNTPFSGEERHLRRIGKLTNASN